MIKKLKDSFKYSYNGLLATYKNERSFKMEILALPFLTLLLLFIPLPIFRKTLMIASYLIIPCLELLNSAIETLADRITKNHDEAIEFVKDAASASVFLGFVLVALIWIACWCF